MEEKIKHREANEAINFLKGIACIYVIFIHHAFPLPFNHYVLSVGRAAVPFFFMVSGYYFYNGKNKKMDIIIKKAGYFLRLGVAMICIYAFKDIIENCILNHARVKEVLFDELNLQSLISFLILNDSPFSGMAWYLFAAMYVYIVAGILYERKIILYILTPVLLVGHLWLADAGFDVHCQMNWLFFGLPCFMIGAFIRDHQDSLIRIKSKTLLSAFVVSYIWAVVEMYINDKKELYLSSLIIAIVSMIWSVNNADFNGGLFGKIGREISLYVYMFQSLVFWISFKILYRIPLPAKDYLMPILGAICTIIGCFCFNNWILIPLKQISKKQRAMERGK